MEDTIRKRFYFAYKKNKPPRVAITFPEQFGIPTMEVNMDIQNVQQRIEYSLLPFIGNPINENTKAEIRNVLNVEFGANLEQI